MHSIPSPAARAATVWQRLRPEQLPQIFYAYDTDSGHSERVVTYALGGEALARLADRAQPSEAFSFVVHLGVLADYLTPDIPEQPAFTLFLQPVNDKHDGGYDHCEQLSWEANGRFSTIDPEGTNSPREAIPAAAAYLFVRSWQELPGAELGRPFTASNRVLGERVRSFRFSNEESLTMLDDIRTSLGSDAPGLAIHLGNGIAIWSHPFSFRPVVEVRRAVADDGAPLPRGRRVSATSNGEGDSFYDFSYPDPPGTGV